ncbi:MAG: MBL fold metallo-hydrolase [Saprospiraceae bacterium]|nr:MBL fold metallo-hydrolase [Saprospiraceae bacterium]
MKVTALHAGNFKLDGGAMFGVVPKRMWQKLNPPDEQNMCTWAMRPLLVQTSGGRHIIVDTGLGNKQDEKFRSHFMPHGDQSLFSSLLAAGIHREDVTDVILTHLHFDHCGGALWKNEETGLTEPSFPNARYWVNPRHWDWAIHPNERERASFLKENFVPLQEAGLLHFLPDEQDALFCEGIKLRQYNGHTEALVAPLITLETGQELLYCADAMPSRWHIGMPYVMAYDIRPLITLEEKAVMLREALDKQQILFFEHDPGVECGTVTKDDSGRIVLDKSGLLSDLI